MKRLSEVDPYVFNRIMSTVADIKQNIEGSEDKTIEGMSANEYFSEQIAKTDVNTSIQDYAISKELDNVAISSALSNGMSKRMDEVGSLIEANKMSEAKKKLDQIETTLSLLSYDEYDNFARAYGNTVADKGAADGFFDRVRTMPGITADSYPNLRQFAIRGATEVRGAVDSTQPAQAQVAPTAPPPPPPPPTSYVAPM